MDYTLPVHEDLSSLLDQFDYFFLDLWGVIHDGFDPYPGATQGLAFLKKHNKHITFISNSSAPAKQSKQELIQMGITNKYYDAITTAGEITRDCLINQSTDWAKKLGKKYYYVGPARRSYLLSDLEYQKVSAPKQADFVLVNGIIETQPEMETYYPLLEECHNLKLPMLCPNPDLIIIKQNNVPRACSGLIAKIYQERYQGQVYLVGKPYPMIYETCLNALNIKNKYRVASIGDSLEHDIQGSINAGITPILTSTGVTQYQVDKTQASDAKQKNLIEYCYYKGIIPHAILTQFSC